MFLDHSSEMRCRLTILNKRPFSSQSYSLNRLDVQYQVIDKSAFVQADNRTPLRVRHDISQIFFLFTHNQMEYMHKMSLFWVLLGQNLASSKLLTVFKEITEK